MKGLPCRFLPCRGGEGGENARQGGMLQSSNLDSGDGVGMLRRMGDVAWSQTFYTFSPSTRLKQERVHRSFWLCRGVEVGESVRRGEARQSANFGAGVSLLRRLGDAAMEQTFYTFSTSTRLKQERVCRSCLPCRGGEGGENAWQVEVLQSTNLETGAWVRQFHGLGDASWSQTFYTFSPSTRLNKRR